MHRVPILCLVALLFVPNGAWAQPLGPEFRANTEVQNGQLRSSIATDAAGNFVIVWTSYGQDGSSGGIYAQRYASTGAPLGGEFRVNTYTTNAQIAPFVAAEPAGSFMVFWNGQQSGGFDVYGQRYDGGGVPLGGEFLVNSQTAGSQFVNSVASDPEGNVVVAMQSRSDGSGYGIFAQRYASTGVPLGGEFQVNTFTLRNQSSPAVATDASGNFVIVWTGPQPQAYAGYDILGQRFSSSGLPLGGEFRVNTYTSGDQFSPAIASDAAGNVIIVWRSDDQRAIFGQRFSSAGAPLGGEFRVNTYSIWEQEDPSVASDPDGNFVVTWYSVGIEGYYYLDVFGQRYSSSGDPLGGQYRINTFTTNNQIYPAVAADPSGNHVVTWTSCWTQDGSGCGVYGQRYGPILSPDGSDVPVE